jgi:HK97 family phage major capsid protein
MSTVAQALAEAQRVRQQFRELGAEERSALVREAEWQIKTIRGDGITDAEYNQMTVEERSKYTDRTLAEITTARDRHRDLEFRSYLTGHQPAGLVETYAPALSGTERRDLGIGTGAAGGYTVPQSFSNRLAKAEASWSAMTQASPPAKLVGLSWATDGRHL